MAFAFLGELSLVNVGVAVAVLCLAAYAYLDWVFGYWRRRNVPCVPPSSFLFGNIGQMFVGQSDIGTIYTDIYRQYPDTPYVGHYEFHHPALLLRDPQLIKKVLVENFNSFHENRPEIKERDDPIFGGNPFFVKGKERWKEQRSPITSALTASKLRQLPESIARVYLDMKAFLSKSTAEDIEAGELCRKFTCDTAASWAWGIEGGGFSEDDPLVKRIAVKIADEIEVSSLKLVLMNYNPWFLKHFNFIKIKFLSPAQSDFFIEVTRQSVKRLIETRSTSPCLLNTLIQGQIKAGLNEKSLVADSKLVEFSASLASFYIDSFETTARTMSYVLYSLAFNPEVQKKLRVEVMKLTDEQVKSDEVWKLPYLESVLNEVLRMYPAGPNLAKVCTQDIKLGDLEVKRGTSIVIPIIGLQRDPKYFSEPDVFKPERFAEGNSAIKEGAYLPFGLGPRQCPGFRFAVNQIKLVVSLVVRDFELLSPVDHEMRPIEQNPSSLLFIPKYPTYIRFKPLISK